MSGPTKQCLQRLQRELRDVMRQEAAAATGTASGEGPAKGPSDASAFISARPDSRNMLRWYFLVAGPAGTPYEGGRYIGSLLFPSDYPFKPPTVSVLTPNGRFETDTAICMSNSSFHPEQWSPIWSVQTIVLGFVSFMVEDGVGAGGIKASDAERRRLAKESRAFNVNHLKYIFERTMPAQFAIDAAWLEAEKKGLHERHSNVGTGSSSPATCLQEASPVTEAAAALSTGSADRSRPREGGDEVAAAACGGDCDKPAAGGGGRDGEGEGHAGAASAATEDRERRDADDGTARAAQQQQQARDGVRPEGRVVVAGAQDNPVARALKRVTAVFFTIAFTVAVLSGMFLVVIS